MNNDQATTAPENDARETLNDLFAKEFDSSFSETALALGREEAEISEIITGNADIDEDLTEKIYRLAQVRLGSDAEE